MIFGKLFVSTENDRRHEQKHVFCAKKKFNLITLGNNIINNV